MSTELIESLEASAPHDVRVEEATDRLPDAPADADELPQALPPSLPMESPAAVPLESPLAAVPLESPPAAVSLESPPAAVSLESPPAAVSLESPPAESESLSGFAAFDLASAIQKAVGTSGYQQPSPIQAAAIPPILAGSDVIGQAETGSGKTAAFALPLLSRLDLNLRAPQVLVLAPTRELAIQVSESFRRYSREMNDLRVTAIYGGAGYEPQLRDLDRGMHVVVGTPGRVMDHMRRGALDLQHLKTVVLDEADQMLQMGFIEDVEWILTQSPQERQVVLFSATMPPAIRKIAEQHLKDPEHITIRGQTATASSIRQRACQAAPHEKLDILSRILDAEPVDGMLVFVKTRSMTNQVSEQLAERGYAVAALSGEMVQSKRERTVAQFKAGRINILVATDVAARGLDVDRVSHVVNYDFPHNAEVYVHRIGRTGRAGRAGEAILFVGRHDKFRLRDIERGTRQRIEWMEKPSLAEIDRLRKARLQQEVAQVLSANRAPLPISWIEAMQSELSANPAEIAAALAQLLLQHRPQSGSSSAGSPPTSPSYSTRPDRAARGDRREGAERGRPRFEREGRPSRGERDRVGHDGRPRDRTRNERTGYDRQEGNYAAASAGHSRSAPTLPTTPDLAAMPHAVEPSDVSQETRSTVPVPSAPAPSASAPSVPVQSIPRQPAPDQPVRSERPPFTPRPQERKSFSERPAKFGTDRSARRPDPHAHGERPRKAGRDAQRMTRYRIEVGRSHGVRPNNIVGALANESQIQGNQIGAIEIFDHHSTVDIGVMLSTSMLDGLQKIRVAGRPLQMSLCDSHTARTPHGSRPPHKFGKPAGGKPAGANAAAGKPWAGKAAGAKPFGKKPFGSKATGSDNTPAGNKPYGKRATEGQASGAKWNTAKPARKSWGKSASGANAGMTTQEKFRANLKKKLRRKSEG